MRAVENLRVRSFTPLITPRALHRRLPLTDDITETIYHARRGIHGILHGEDPRMLMVVGPCSIHDPEAALEYARRLRDVARQYRERLLIVMRVYLEKPRTTVGWRGLINDPHLDGSFDMGQGLTIARELLLQINALGLPAATEMLDPISPQYLSDLISLAAIGARTTESQTHRAMASGLSMPVGFKNSTDGSIQAAINACISSTHEHSFFGIDEEGVSCVVKTAGNPDGFVILRGSKHGPNYDADSIAAAEADMRASGLQPAIMIDCSHANSQSDHTRQKGILEQTLTEHIERRNSLVGLMVESNLHPGKQPISADRAQLAYGVSVTDACVGWEETEDMLAFANRVLGG